MSHSTNECEAVLARLNDVCASIRSVETREEPAEQAYVQLLEFLQEHSACQSRLEVELESMVIEFRHARKHTPRLSIDALAFCMHSLKWQGVLRTAQREHREFFVARRDDFLWRLMDAYLPDWNEKAEYAYYTNQHNGGSDA